MSAVSVTSTVVPMLIRTAGHADSSNHTKQSSKEAGPFRWRTVIVHIYVDFFQRLVLFEFLLFLVFIFFLFTQIFRQQNIPLLADFDDNLIIDLAV